MSSFICPECDTKTDVELCPNCGTKTLKMKQQDTVDPMIGKVLDGRYKIDSLIGRGGMGAVYKAVQTSMKKIVAVKLIRIENASETEAVKRFHREVKAASLLSHPHSIKVFDFGQSEDGDLYMVMEFLDGKSLGKALKTDGPFAPSRALKILCEVAQSLAEAHSVGLVHRDLKPDNVMLLNIFGDPDFVKVLDFGIAKFMEGSGEAAVTRTGVAVGTPHYMAPEQARGRQNLGPSADIYALGVMLFELLSGYKPFDAESSVEVLFAHVQNPIPELPDECPASENLRDLVRRMMAKEPEERPTAEELIQTANELRPHEAGFADETRRATVIRPSITPGKAAKAITGQEPSRGMSSRAQPEARTAVIPAADDDIPQARPRRSTGAQQAAAEKEPSSGSGKGLVIGIVLAVVVLGLGAGAYMMFGQSEPIPTPSPIDEPVKKPITEQKPKEPEKKPTPLKMKLDSAPQGAVVKDGTKELGKTPFEYEFEPNSRKRALVFQLDGYENLSQDVEVKADGMFLAKLARKPEEKVVTPPTPKEPRKPKTPSIPKEPKPKGDGGSGGGYQRINF